MVDPFLWNLKHLPVSRYSTSNVTQWLTWPWYDHATALLDMHHLTCGINSLLHSSTSLCSLSSWFTPSYAYHLITVITFVLSHHLSPHRPFTPDLKLISFTNPFLHITLTPSGLTSRILSGWWRRVHRRGTRYVSCGPEDWTLCSTCSGLPSSPVWRRLRRQRVARSHEGVRVRSTTHQFCARPRPAPRILSTGPADIWWTVWHRRRRTIQYKKAVL